MILSDKIIRHLTTYTVSMTVVNPLANDRIEITFPQSVFTNHLTTPNAFSEYQYGSKINNLQGFVFTGGQPGTSSVDGSSNQVFTITGVTFNPNTTYVSFDINMIWNPATEKITSGNDMLPPWI